MPQEPGPIEPLNPAAFDLAVTLPPWPAAATEGEDEFEYLAAELEAGLAELAEAAGEEWAEELSQLHADAEEGVWHDPLTTDEAELGDATQAAIESDSLLIEAYSALPGECWTNPPGSYVPPPEQGGFTVLPETVPTRPGIPPGVTPGGAPGPTAPTATIINLTRGGSTQFWVNDNWMLTITGEPLMDITCTGSYNGEPFGPTPFGIVGGTGQWTYNGTMFGQHRGLWIEQWSVGGVPCWPTLEFEVI